ncbi:MAG: CHAT domain-containing protein, partial [Planctomycetes bacterium]|nr:CHAT domain-containing protein [Planctomycetota bacterium]
DVANSLASVACCLHSLGRSAEALPQYKAALAMERRIYGEEDHPDVALGLNNVAGCLQSLGRFAEALPQYEAALAMRRRVYGDEDHPYVAMSLNDVAVCLKTLGRSAEALGRYDTALAMSRRMYGEKDHPYVAKTLNNMAACLDSLGRSIEALPNARAACSMVERLRDSSRVSTDLRQSFFDELKRGGAFDRLQKLAQKTKHVDEAMRAAERSRARRLLDLLEQSRGDPWLEAQRRASLRGDTALATSIPQIRAELEASRLESDRLLHQLTALSSAKLEVEERAARRAKLLEEASVAKATKDRLENERARVLSDVLPIGRVRTSTEIQAALQQGELLLQYTVTKDVALLYVLGPEGAVEAIALPTAHARLERELEPLLQLVAHRQEQGKRGETLKTRAAKKAPSSSTALFEALIPKQLWPRVKSARRVFIAPHRALHRLPFEALVTEVREGKPLYWLDAGPAISYVPSGTALHWLRKRAKEASDDDTAIDLLAVGDPRGLDEMPELPEEGVFVVKVNDAGPGAQAGIHPGDVLVSYDGKPLTDDKSLRDLADKTNAAIEDGERDNSAIPIGVWRRGETLHVEVHERVLEIEVGRGPARSAYKTYLAAPERMQTVTRAGELERLRALPALLGARAETEAIDAAIRAKGGKTRTLLGSQASEPAVFELAAQAKFLHFACHGVAEEYAGQSLSTLVLSQPEHVLPGEDGLLKLEDLLTTWRGRLSSCQLVVLSACRTNVGPTLRDEAPHALPIGFMYAGAPSVVSSLWAVDDASTRELMTDFYARLMAGETDRLAAFTAAKKALRKKYPDPFHWAPFLFMGSPGS